jgi:hypothetical protein
MVVGILRPLATHSFQLCMRKPSRSLIDPQIAVAAADDRIGHHSLGFLRHHADIGLALPL